MKCDVKIYSCCYYIGKNIIRENNPNFENKFHVYSVIV